MASLQVNQLQPKGLIQEKVISIITEILSQFGVTLNGKDPADVQIKSDAVFYRFFKFSLGLDPMVLGESYMDGQWDCEDLTTLIAKMLREPSTKRLFFVRWVPRLLSKISVFLSTNNKSDSEKDISSHYDIGNDLYQLMLDRTMNYSCAYWQRIAPIGSVEARNGLCESLQEAQINKMLLIGRKLSLQPGMRVLDIGCGWGVHVVAITISKEQLAYAKTTDVEQDELEFLRVPGLGSDEGSFEFRLEDYRDVKQTFDRIVSVGMFEHVGVNNYDEFFTGCRRCLKDDGLLLLHTIGLGHSRMNQTDPWANKYIFPGGALPYHTQIMKASLDKFLVEDWHNFGYDYYRTLCAWKTNFDKGWPKLQGKYDGRFRRMWTFYLCAAAAGFKRRKFQLWQIVFSKKGLDGGYPSCR